MTKQTKDIITIVSILIFAILAIIFVPLATIWSLNTLFPILSIPYTFYSWLAVMNLTWMYKPTFKKD
jgi:multidrug efflux pump subunit AcrB